MIFVSKTGEKQRVSEFAYFIALIGSSAMLIFIVMPYFLNAYPQSNSENPYIKCTPFIDEGIGHPERFKFISHCVSVTGLVTTQPHYAPDADLVYAIKPNEQNITSLLTSGNEKKEGLWI